MARIAIVFGFLLGVGVALLTVHEAAAQDREKVATFVVSDGQGDSPLIEQVLADVRAHLVKQGRTEVYPDIESRSEKKGLGLDNARSVGRSAFSELAEGRAPEEVLRSYGTPIVNSLNEVSSVHDPEGRSLLWNLCALRVHLLLLSGDSAGEATTRDAVLDCSRRFVDRPNLGKAWLQEVARTFSRFTTDVRQVAVSVKTAPAGCELRIYGAVVGVTPMLVDLIPGPYEFQIACGERVGALHRVNVSEGRDLTIRLAADEAYSRREDVSWLRYKNGASAAQLLDDVAALALEAEAASFVLVKIGYRSELEVQWLRPSGTLLGTSKLEPQAAPEKRAQRVASVFRPEVAGPSDDRGASNRRRRRLWSDYALGGGLLAAGAAVAVYPLLAMVRDGQCVDSACNAVYDGRGWKAAMSLAAAGGLVASGVTVLWVAPFGKRYSLSIADRIVIRGTF